MEIINVSDIFQLARSRTFWNGRGTILIASYLKLCMIAPIHAAALSNSPEMFKLVLETKGVDPDTVGLYNGKPLVDGVLEFAVNGGNLDIIGKD